MSSDRRAGFTLIEILLALAVLSMLAIAGLGLLLSALDSREAAATANDRLTQLQHARSILREDIAQLRLRPARDGDGFVRPWQFLGNPRPAAGEPLMAFLRGGWRNPRMAEPRSELVYVEYRFEGDHLLRSVVPRPDPTRATPSVEQRLLDGVGDLKLSYLSNGGWRPGWRVPADQAGQLPDAIALEAELTGFGRLRQIFLAPGAPS